MTSPKRECEEKGISGTTTSRYSLRSRKQGYIPISYDDLQHGIIVESGVTKTSIARITAEKCLKQSREIGILPDEEGAHRFEMQRKRRSDADQQGLFECPEPEEATEEEDESYCICKKAGCGLKMVSCDKCSGWFHLQCVEMDREEEELVDSEKIGFACPSCVDNECPSTFTNSSLEERPGVYCLALNCDRAPKKPALYCCSECIDRYVDCCLVAINRDLCKKQLVLLKQDDRLMMQDPVMDVLMTRGMPSCPTVKDVKQVITPHLVKYDLFMMTETFYADKIADYRNAILGPLKRRRMTSESEQTHACEKQCIRYRAKERLFLELMKRRQDVGFRIREDAVLFISFRVEEIMFDALEDSSNTYSTHYTSLIHNIRDTKNPDFFKYILAGAYDYELIATMHSHQMLSEAKKVQRLVNSRKETDRWVEAARVEQSIGNNKQSWFDTLRRSSREDLPEMEPSAQDKMAVIVNTPIAAEDDECVRDGESSFTDEEHLTITRVSPQKYGLWHEDTDQFSQSTVYFANIRPITVGVYEIAKLHSDTIHLPEQFLVRSGLSYQLMWEYLAGVVLRSSERQLTVLGLVPMSDNERSQYEKIVFDLALKDKCGVCVSESDKNRFVFLVPFMADCRLFSFLLARGVMNIGRDHDAILVTFIISCGDSRVDDMYSIEKFPAQVDGHSVEQHEARLMDRLIEIEEVK
ncbi:hypothetical protein ACOME3_004372 [Neoechinorhynchus agilis]